MLGLNRTITVIKVERSATDSGAIDEVEGTTEGVDRWSNIPATLQAHVLANLPPPGDRVFRAGEHYLDEYRCWIPRSATDPIGLVPKDSWIVQDEDGVKYRIKAVIDDGGRRHHWLLRLERYD